MVFVRAKKGPPPAESEKYTVHYFDQQGNLTVKSSGSKAWRNKKCTLLFCTFILLAGCQKQQQANDLNALKRNFGFDF